MSIKKSLTVGLLVIGILAGSVVLFFAGDHEDENRTQVSTDAPSPT